MGFLDVDLGAMQPDFYTGSSHKWPCGPKEVGVLYVNARANENAFIPASSAHIAGTIGISRRMEAMGQRDEPAIIGFGEAIRFETKIGLQSDRSNDRDRSRKA